MSTLTATRDTAALAHAICADAQAAGALLLCTDYDGTLSPIAPTPESANPLATAVSALTWLSRSGAERGEGARVPVRVATITSRACAHLVDRLQLGPEAIIVGSAGLERWSRGHIDIDPEVVEWLPAIDEAAGRLATALAEGRAPGARLERKQCGVAIHTRGLHSAEAERDALLLAREVGEVTGLRVQPAKHALELRPPLDRDKGTALLDLRGGALARAAVCAAGDDFADIPMLEAAIAQPHSTAVAVVDVETPAAVIDVASAAVDGPWGWAEVLQSLVEELRRS
ncbi:MAG TPA: trehalose-phosphatase [Candidatus Dormibacteraeota bacterium]